MTLDEDDAEYLVDDYENMTEEELKEKLPPYWFKTNKQKKKFFNNLNKTFKEHLIKNQRKKKIQKKITFQL